MAFDTHDNNDRFRDGLYGWLLSFPAEYAITITFAPRFSTPGSTVLAYDPDSESCKRFFNPEPCLNPKFLNPGDQDKLKSLSFDHSPRTIKGVTDIGQATSKLVRWLSWQKKRVHSDLAMAGVFTGNGRHHFHGFLWGLNNRGVQLAQNPRFTIDKINHYDRRHCPGFIKVRDFSQYPKDKSAAYAVYSNWDTTDEWCGRAAERIFDPVTVCTHKKLLGGIA